MNSCLDELNHCVYTLSCHDGSAYTGYSTRLDARFMEHRKGEVKYTSTRLPVELNNAIYFKDKYKALAYEKYLKSGSGKAVMNKRLL